MEIILAGLNVDAEVLAELEGGLRAARDALAAGGPAHADSLADLDRLIERRDRTPETLSAAYARISRDPRPAPVLRREARAEVERARQSNERIIFGLGHASVAEHAVFNLDVLGVSRLAAEFVERFRLCSYTEKSQRYITLDGDHVVPDEVAGTEWEAPFRSLVDRQNQAYEDCRKVLLAHLVRRDPGAAATSAGRRAMEGMAKEDARYCLGLATQAQLGMTLNARNVERVIQAAAAHPLREVREFGVRLGAVLAGLAPSLIKYTRPERLHQEGLPALAQGLRAAVAASVGPPPQTSPSCRLVGATPGAEAIVLAALAHEAGGGDFDRCQRWAETLTREGARSLLRPLVDCLESYHALPRALEYASATFECVVSASCFAQLKRHRMATLTVQPYDPGLGVMVPPLLEEAGAGEVLRRVADESGALVGRLAGSIGGEAAAYALTNAHRRRLLFQANLRSMFHFARLRRDAHAQWDIRNLADDMAAALAGPFPLLATLLCGKDRFAETRRAFLNSDPA